MHRAPAVDDRELEKEIAELQKQRALEEGRLASFGTASGDFDNDLYGGPSASSAYVTSIGVGGDDDDEDYGDHMSEAASSIRKLTGRYTAPKSVYKDIPKNDEEEADPFAEYRKSRVADRDDDYKKRRMNRQLSTAGTSYRDRMIETALEREHDRVLREVDKKKKQEKEEAEKKLKERQEHLREQEKLRRKEEKRKRKDERRRLKEEKRRKKRKLEGGAEEEEEAEDKDSDSDSENEKKATTATKPDVEEKTREERKSEWDDEGEGNAETEAARRRAAMAAHLKHKEPSDAKKPDRAWVLHVFKSGQALGAPLDVSKRSCYLFGREAELADIVTAHESCSKQHAALQFREVGGTVRPYLIDVGSANGTFLNKQKLKPNEYAELKEGDTVVMGCSTRQYVLQQERYKRR